MYFNKKEIEVNGKKYTLTTRRSIIFKMQEVAPELIKISKGEADENTEYNAGIKIYDNMPTFFYELLKPEQPDISKEESDNIYYDFCEEYNDVDEKLLEFMQSSFTDGIPREKKKNLNW